MILYRSYCCQRCNGLLLVLISQGFTFACLQAEQALNERNESQAAGLQPPAPPSPPKDHAQEDALEGPFNGAFMPGSMDKHAPCNLACDASVHMHACIHMACVVRTMHDNGDSMLLP